MEQGFNVDTLDLAAITSTDVKAQNAALAQYLPSVMDWTVSYTFGRKANNVKAFWYVFVTGKKWSAFTNPETGKPFSKMRPFLRTHAASAITKYQADHPGVDGCERLAQHIDGLANAGALVVNGPAEEQPSTPKRGPVAMMEEAINKYWGKVAALDGGKEAERLLARMVDIAQQAGVNVSAEQTQPATLPVAA